MTATAPTRSEVSRQAILDTAARLLRHRGFADVSLRDIADEVGMKAGSLYYHFASKEDLVAEVLRIGVETVHQAVAQAIEDVDGVARVRAAVHAHLHALLRVSDYTSAHVRIFAHVPAEVRRRNLPVRDRYDALWRDLLAHAQASGVIRADADLKAIRLFLIGAMNGVLEWYLPGRKSVDALAREFADVVLLGIGRRRR